MRVLDRDSYNRVVKRLIALGGERVHEDKWTESKTPHVCASLSLEIKAALTESAMVQWAQFGCYPGSTVMISTSDEHTAVHVMIRGAL